MKPWQLLTVAARSLVANPTRSLLTVLGAIIGVAAVISTVAIGNDLDDQVVIPLTMYQRLLSGGMSNVRRAVVQVRSGDQMAPVAEEITALLRRRHQIGAGSQPDFKVENQLSVLNAAHDVTATFTYLIAGLAAVSLLVGGIGIMNIMLVAVAERTHEIGVRKAVGATDEAVLGQFLLEAAALSVFGGLLGVAVGIGAAGAITRVAGWHTLVSPGSIALALGVSLVVGLFFGVYPASRAARLAPIEALRYE